MGKHNLSNSHHKLDENIMAFSWILEIIIPLEKIFHPTVDTDSNSISNQKTPPGTLETKFERWLHSQNRVK